MDSLPAWARWIVVAVLGLSPMLIYLIAGLVRRFLRRRRWPLPPGAARSLPTGRHPPRKTRLPTTASVTILGREVSRRALPPALPIRRVQQVG